MRLADRLGLLEMETSFQMLARARALEAQGRSIIHFGIGEPDFDTPQNIVDAGKKALDDGFTHYTPSAGLMAFREVLADYISRTRGVEALPQQVVVTPGAKPIMFFAILATVEPGDEVIYPNPGFSNYEPISRFAEAKVVPLKMEMEKDFRFDPDHLAELVSPRTRMIILNSPGNPTGGILSRDDLKAVADLAIDHDIWVLSDEIYSRILYDDTEFHSVASIDGMEDRTILMEGFSKTYAMTGWRLGYGVMPERLAEQVARIQVNSNSCTAAFTQMAGIEAITGPQESVTTMVSEFATRREILWEGLNSLPGFRCLKPSGAFYLFPNIEQTGMTSEQLSDLFLGEAGVACLKGTCFGALGEGYLRFSFANSQENIREGLERIRVCMDRHGISAGRGVA